MKVIINENQLMFLVEKVKTNKFQYQVRDIGGSDVYYKKKVGDKFWKFIEKDEFDKKSNKDNLVKYKKK